MKFDVRLGTQKDAQGIVELFSEGGNPHNWTFDKWSHYYQDYPEGEAITFVAESEDRIIGHYGLFPVVIGGYNVYMGAHAYISESVRGLAVISSMMKALDYFCIEKNVPFIVGFANPRFTIVKTKLFKWKAPLYANFVKCKQFDPEVYLNRPLSFSYSERWIDWRFGEGVKAPVVSCYQRNTGDKPSFQLLHSTKKVEVDALGLPELECWSPDEYATNSTEERFSQPFSVKIYDKNWNGPSLEDPANWFIQMGDSDTFVFKGI